jgi:hypothetical protein
VTNWWKIARLDLLLAFKDRGSVIWGLLAPLLFAAFFGMMGSSGDPVVQARLERGENPEYVGDIFRGYLEKEGIVITDDDEAPAILLADSLIHHLLAGEGAEIRVKTESESNRTRLLQAKVQKVLMTLVIRAKSRWLTDPPGEEERAAMFAASGPIHLETEPLGRKPRDPSGTEQTMPQMVVMFLFFSLFTFYAALWVEDVKTGKIKRITMSPTAPRALFLGVVASRMTWGAVQVVFLALVGTILFRIRWELPYPDVAVLLTAYMLAVTSLGLFFSSFFENPDKAGGLGVLISLTAAALGGCWWPLEFVPGPMRIVALMTPTGLTMDAFGDFLSDGKYAAFPGRSVAGLLVMSGIIMPLAVRRMKKQIVK